MTACFCHCSLCFAVIIFIYDGIFLLLIFLPNSEGCHYSECDQASDLWQQLVLASALEMDLQETIDCSKKVIVDFNTGKMHLFHLKTLLLWKWLGLFLKKNCLLRSCRIATGPGKSWNFIQYLSDEFSFLSNLFEFLPSRYVRYSTSFFFIYLPVSRIKI